MNPLVIGVGAHGRGDDSVGIKVAKAVAMLGLPQVDVVETVAPTDLVRVMDGRDTVVIVDAMVSGRPPGSVVVFAEVPTSNGPAGAGTHGLGVAQAVQLAQALGRLPRTLRFVGVEVADVGYGEEMSATVQSAVPEAVAVVRRLVLHED